MQVEGVKVLDRSGDAFVALVAGKVNLINLHRVLVDIDFVDADGTEYATVLLDDTCASPFLHQGSSMINVVILSLELLKMRVVVVGAHARVGAIDAFIHP